jgi:hypothetical protein
MGNFYQDVIQKWSGFHSTDRCAQFALLAPKMKTAVQAIIIDAHAEGVELMLYESYRSTERQEQLFAQHATELQHNGVHHYGLAADIVHVVNGQPSWDGDFSILGRLADKYGLIWGGDWGAPNKHHTFIDQPHVQFIHVDQQDSLFAGTFYPEVGYPITKP